MNYAARKPKTYIFCQQSNAVEKTKDLLICAGSNPTDDCFASYSFFFNVEHIINNLLSIIRVFTGETWPKIKKLQKTKTNIFMAELYSIYHVPKVKTCEKEN